MNSGLVLDIHLIKLIDAANTVIGKHQGTSLNAELSSLRVFTHRGCQTGRVRGFTTTVDGSGQELADILKELTLGCRWVANDADVNITS